MSTFPCFNQYFFDLHNVPIFIITVPNYCISQACSVQCQDVDHILFLTSFVSSISCQCIKKIDVWFCLVLLFKEFCNFLLCSNHIVICFLLCYHNFIFCYCIFNDTEIDRDDFVLIHIVQKVYVWYSILCSCLIILHLSSHVSSFIPHLIVVNRSSHFFSLHHLPILPLHSLPHPTSFPSLSPGPF